MDNSNPKECEGYDDGDGHERNLFVPSEYDGSTYSQMQSLSH